MILLFLALILGYGKPSFASLSLDSAIDQALQNNPEVHASLHQAEAEHSKVRSRYFLSDPMLGYEKDGTGMKSWMLTQEIMFPTKYFTMGSAQRHRARAFDEASLTRQLEIRRKVITGYFRFFALNRISALLDAQLNVAREIARVAEAKRSTGAVPQQDEMKAHVEETRANAEILMVQEEKTAAEAELRALLALEPESPLTLDTPQSHEIAPPSLRLSAMEIETRALTHSPVLRKSHWEVEEMGAERHAATQSWLPDFRLTYMQPFDTGDEHLGSTIRIEATLPLWFAARQTAVSSAGRSTLSAAEKMHEQAKLETRARARMLAAKAHARATLLKIDGTSLIPQATATLNSSQAAYRAGRIALLELIDSERALYSIRIAYYRNLIEYADTVAEIELLLGESASDLPFPTLLKEID